MTDEQLKAIRERLELVLRARDLPLTPGLDAWEDFEQHAPDDIAALLAEVERLRSDRDAWQETAALRRGMLERNGLPVAERPGYTSAPDITIEVGPFAAPSMKMMKEAQKSSRRLRR